MRRPPHCGKTDATGNQQPRATETDEEEDTNRTKTVTVKTPVHHQA